MSPAAKGSLMLLAIFLVAITTFGIVETNKVKEFSVDEATLVLGSGSVITNQGDAGVAVGIADSSEWVLYQSGMEPIYGADLWQRVC